MNQAVRRDATNARALYLRGAGEGVRGTAGRRHRRLQPGGAQRAGEGGGVRRGEAHVYRGISLYRRKEYTAAEDEFTNALNFEISAASRADAVAWRRLAAVASGSCETGRKYLEEVAAGGLAILPARRSPQGDCGVHRHQDGGPSAAAEVTAGVC